MLYIFFKIYPFAATKLIFPYQERELGDICRFGAAMEPLRRINDSCKTGFIFLTLWLRDSRKSTNQSIATKKKGFRIPIIENPHLFKQYSTKHY